MAETTTLSFSVCFPIFEVSYLSLNINTSASIQLAFLFNFGIGLFYEVVWQSIKPPFSDSPVILGLSSFPQWFFIFVVVFEVFLELLEIVLNGIDWFLVVVLSMMAPAISERRFQVGFVFFSILEWSRRHLLVGLRILLPRVISKALKSFVPDIPLDRYMVDFGEEVRLVHIRMMIWVFGSEAEEGLFSLSLPIVKSTAYLLHIDDSVNLTGCQLAQSVLAAGTDYLLVHSHLDPVFRDIFFFSLVEKWGFFVAESRCVDFYKVCWDRRRELRLVRALTHFLLVLFRQKIMKCDEERFFFYLESLKSISRSLFFGGGVETLNASRLFWFIIFF